MFMDLLQREGTSAVSFGWALHQVNFPLSPARTSPSAEEAPGIIVQVQTASLVCVQWHAVARQALLDDTAGSKPQFPPLPTKCVPASNSCDMSDTPATIAGDTSVNATIKGTTSSHPTLAGKVSARECTRDTTGCVPAEHPVVHKSWRRSRHAVKRPLNSQKDVILAGQHASRSASDGHSAGLEAAGAGSMAVEPEHDCTKQDNARKRSKRVAEQLPELRFSGEAADDEAGQSCRWAKGPSAVEGPSTALEVEGQSSRAEVRWIWSSGKKARVTSPQGGVGWWQDAGAGGGGIAEGMVGGARAGRVWEGRAGLEAVKGWGARIWGVLRGFHG